MLLVFGAFCLQAILMAPKYMQSHVCAVLYRLLCVCACAIEYHWQKRERDHTLITTADALTDKIDKPALENVRIVTQNTVAIKLTR